MSAPNPSIDRISPASLPATRADSPESSALPPWWRGDRGQFDALADKRLRVHRHERAAARRAQSIIVASLLVAISVHSIDATGAVIIPAGSGFLTLFVAVALPIILAWLLDRRLLQQLQDVNLRSHLWIDLVDAVKHGHIDVAQLELAPVRETEIEEFLRKEAALAARFLASRRTLVPHVPVFGHCFTLENN